MRADFLYQRYFYSAHLAKFKLLLHFAQKTQFHYLGRRNIFLNFASRFRLENRRLHGCIGGAAIATHGLYDQLVAFIGLLAVQFPKALREGGHLLWLLADEQQSLYDRAHHFFDLVGAFFYTAFARAEDA